MEFLYWLKEIKNMTFFGLKKPQKVKGNLLIKMLIASAILTALGFLWAQNYNMGSEDISLLAFKETGSSIQTILIIMIQTIIRTSFLEEIIFRGFLINSLEKN